VGRSPATKSQDALPALAVAQPDGALIALWSTVAYLLVIMTGFIVLRLPGATIAGNELSVEKALFMTINAGSLTGFQQNTAIDSYGASGQACLVLLTVAGTLFSLIVGGMAVVRIVGMPYRDVQVVRATLMWYVVATFAAAALLAEPARPLKQAIVQAASAFGNSGLVLGSLPAITDWRTHMVLMPLATLGALGIPVLLDLGGMIFGHGRLSMHSRVVLAMTAGFYLFGFVLCVPWNNFGHLSSADRIADLATASAASVDTRTAGLPVIALSSMPRMIPWMLIILMVIGGASGSAAGGLKVTTLYELFRGFARALRGQGVSRIFGITGTWLGLYLLLMLGTLLALLALQPELPADRLVFISISAISNVGLSHDPISMTGPGLMVLSAAMLLGRLVPLAILWYAALAIRNADVAVG